MKALATTMFGLLLILTGYCLSVTSVSAQGPEGNQQEVPEITRMEYATPLEFTLIAKPGESITHTVEVPVNVYFADGTEQHQMETIEFTLTNQRMRQDKGAVGNSLTTSCSANLNATDKYFTGQVTWGHDGATAWHISNSAPTYYANSPWQVNGYSASFSGPSYTVTGHTSGSFVFPTRFLYATHKLNWTLAANGNCSATGQIFS